ncbi:MAG: hypothetical protein CVT67_00350 [Actinobacteria bacterium HGW-Actinobacteria-7]|jgi:ABC-type glycerol-3-phosphate transport system substrate-binding protein|nr:MAG: hypothetical protein CVT67_00350 [Actinobacteria bacterium HGW-Actinobacteria-7]
MRRTALVLGAVVLVAGLTLVACGGSTVGSSEQPSATTATGGLLEPADRARDAASDANQLIDQQEKSSGDVESP